jgi:hypothetical protein
VTHTETRVIIYPNPSQDIITLNGEESEINRTRIYNLLGQDVTQQTREIKNAQTIITIDLKDLNPGIYYIKTMNTVNKIYKE